MPSIGPSAIHYQKKLLRRNIYTVYLTTIYYFKILIKWCYERFCLKNMRYRTQILDTLHTNKSN